MANFITQFVYYILAMSNRFHLDFMERVMRRYMQELNTDSLREQLPAKVTEAGNAFLTAEAAEDDAYKLTTKSDLTEQIVAADQKRDALNNALRLRAESYLTDPLASDEQREAAKKLTDSMAFYQIHTGDNLTRQGIDTEQMLQEWLGSAKFMKALNTLSLKPLAEALQEANNATRTLIDQRNKERSQREKEMLANARKATDEAYKTLVEVVNAAHTLSATADGDSIYKSFIDVLNSDIEYFKNVVLPKKKEGETPTPEPEPEPDDKKDDGGEQDDGSDDEKQEE